MKRRGIFLVLSWWCVVATSCLYVNVTGAADSAKIGGPLKVDGPLAVHGNLYVGGPATVHGPVHAAQLTVGGPLTTTLPKGEPAGPSGQAYATSLAIGGPLTVQGPLVVDGSLIVGGPLLCEPGQGQESGETPQQGGPYQPQNQLPSQQSPQQQWTE